MICQSFIRFSQKHANRFVPLPYQPENNDIPVKTPPTGFDALRTLAVSRTLRIDLSQRPPSPVSSPQGEDIVLGGP
jgi:2-iminoacetate synthase ThiH